MQATNVIELNAAPKAEPQPSKSRMKTIAGYKLRTNAKAGKWTKGEIQGLTKLLNAANYERLDVTKNAIWDVQSAAEYRADHPAFVHSITAEQTELGIEWLRLNMMTRKGTANALLRKSAYDSQDADAILSIIKTFTKFRFVGVHVERNGHGSEWHYPVYRTYGKGGSYFDYTPVHWVAPIIHTVQLPK